MSAPPYKPPTNGPTAVAQERVAGPDDTDEEDDVEKTTSASGVQERSWDRWLKNSTFDPIKAIWMENRFLLLLTLGYLLLHGLGGWFPCQHSARADLMTERVVTLLRELDGVSKRVPVVQSPSKLP
jgi:hypothetical protein